MSFNNKLQELPLEIALQIASYLSAQELLNASASCKSLYTSFVDQSVWKATYIELLNGYPADHFVVTDAVKHAERPNCINLHSQQDVQMVWLEEWRTSWKQRTVFVLHVLNVQRQLVANVHEQNQVFKPELAVPLHDSDCISRMEQYVGAIFPIDFVLFLQNFAHCLTVDYDPLLSANSMLASGSMFEDEQSWKEAIHFSQFTEFNAGGTEQQRLARIPNLSNTTLRYLNGIKSVCFSMPATIEDTWDGRTLDGREYLSLVLDIDSSLQDQVPPMIVNDDIHVDFASLKNSVGKVAYNHIFINPDCALEDDVVEHDHHYRYRCIAESFTDYLVQYIAVVIRLGYLPQGQLGKMVGYGDLVSPLPRFPGLPKSILLPQYEGWDVANYCPVYFSSIRAPLHFPMTASARWSETRTRQLMEWDSHLPDPPLIMMNGFQQAWWEPYCVREALQSGSIPKSFDAIKGKDMPKPKSRQITVDIYRTMHQMIEAWIDSALSKLL